MTDSISSPPLNPVRWRVRCGDCYVTVTHRRWFDARADGAAKLGVQVEDVICEMEQQ